MIDDTIQTAYMLSVKKYWNIVEYVSHCYTKTVILLRNSEFKVYKVVYD